MRIESSSTWSMKPRARLLGSVLLEAIHGYVRYTYPVDLNYLQAVDISESSSDFFVMMLCSIGVPFYVFLPTESTKEPDELDLWDRDH